MSLEEDRDRYTSALHGIQTAIAFELSIGVEHIRDPKHLRTGIDSTFISISALQELLIEKGILTLEEITAKTAHYAERELLGYEAKYPGVHFR